jgi:hypothetical protein
MIDDVACDDITCGDTSVLDVIFHDGLLFLYDACYYPRMVGWIFMKFGVKVIGGKSRLAHSNFYGL